MNILLITPIYPGPGIPKTDTPVVHYFAREWVKEGHKVRVFFIPAVFPAIYYKAASLIKDHLSSRAGFGVRTEKPLDMEYVIDGVPVVRIGQKKLIPHSMPSISSFKKITDTIKKKSNDEGFVPDYVVGHFANPSLMIMSMLRDVYKAVFCYVAHGGAELDVYGEKTCSLLNDIDILGFRSRHIKEVVCKRYNWNGPNFMCYSGIPETFIEKKKDRCFGKVQSFLYVGTLIERKYPSALVPAINEALEGGDFEINYVGNGKESKRIMEMTEREGCKEKVRLLGRISRDEVCNMMDRNDVFVMISRNETYGLVYLEAMSRGMITIASKNEGFDGIIEDGVNGFLCEAGNVAELTDLIKEIRSMSEEKLQTISENAWKTATALTDRNVANAYLKSLSKTRNKEYNVHTNKS